MIAGYAYAPLPDQHADLDAQLKALAAQGYTSLWQEKPLAPPAKVRPQLRAAIASLEQGDILRVARLDVLASSLPDLLKIIDTLQAKGAVLHSLDLDVDASTPTQDVIRRTIAAATAFQRRAKDTQARAEGRRPGRTPTAQLQANEIFALKAQGLKSPEIATRLGLGERSVFRVLAQPPPESPPARSPGQPKQRG